MHEFASFHVCTNQGLENVGMSSENHVAVAHHAVSPYPWSVGPTTYACPMLYESDTFTLCGRTSGKAAPPVQVFVDTSSCGPLKVRVLFVRIVASGASMPIAAVELEGEEDSA
jgi:hypothetical protein